MVALPPTASRVLPEPSRRCRSKLAAATDLAARASHPDSRARREAGRTARHDDPRTRNPRRRATTAGASRCQNNAHERTQ
jgi:hypothetical protein